MSAKFYTLLTDIGAAKLASAAALGVPLKITQMAVGDGGGKLPTPSAQQTKLIAEKRRAALNTLFIDPQNSSQIIAEQVIPETEGGWWIREVGLYDDTGALIAVGNCPETYKPLLAEGSGRTQTVRMVLITSNADTITLKIDPSIVLATRQYVDGAIETHAKSRNHPDATLSERGFVRLSSATNSSSETMAATPKAIKAAFDLANGKYSAEDASTAKRGLVQLSSATNSSSETVAATSKAVRDVASAAVKKVNGITPDNDGNVDLLTGDATQPVVIFPMAYSGSQYMYIATIKDCGSGAGYFQLMVSGSGGFGSRQNIEFVTVSCRGLNGMNATNADRFIYHQGLTNGDYSIMSVVLAPAVVQGQFDVYLNAPGGWWASVKMQMLAMTGDGVCISGPVVDRKLATKWFTTVPENSIVINRQSILTDAAIGTSGAKLAQLDGENTWGKKQTFSNGAEFSAARVVNASAGVHVQSTAGNAHVWFRHGDGAERGVIYSPESTEKNGEIRLRAKNNKGVNNGEFAFHSDGTLSVPGSAYLGGAVVPGDYGNLDSRYLLRSQDLPVGIPLPWSTNTAPAGWLKCNGAPFDKARFPGLATAYPSGKLPDLRGEFIRGWDDGRDVDDKRALLSSQGDAIRNIVGSIGGVQFAESRRPKRGNGPFDSVFAGAYGRYESFTTEDSAEVGQEIFTMVFDASRQVPTASENRPRNTAFNYIVRAA